MYPLVGYLLLFVAVGIGFILVHLLIGKVVRPARPDAEKLTIYECGEPTVGSAWVQFDLRFYVIALLFVIFDVEVAFFFPWAVVFGQANAVAQARSDVRGPMPSQLPVAHDELMRGEVVYNEQALAARQFSLYALVDILVFFGVLLVGFAYLWRRGDLAWVRSTAAERPAQAPEPEPARPPELVGVGGKS